MQCPSCGTTELPLCSKWCLACGEKLPPHLNAPQTEPERESVAETENNLEVDNRQIQGGSRQPEVLAISRQHDKLSITQSAKPTVALSIGCCPPILDHDRTENPQESTFIANNHHSVGINVTPETKPQHSHEAGVETETPDPTEECPAFGDLSTHTASLVQEAVENIFHQGTEFHGNTSTITFTHADAVQTLEVAADLQKNNLNGTSGETKVIGEPQQKPSHQYMTSGNDDHQQQELKQQHQGEQGDHLHMALGDHDPQKQQLSHQHQQEQLSFPQQEQEKPQLPSPQTLSEQQQQQQQHQEGRHETLQSIAPPQQQIEPSLPQQNRQQQETQEVPPSQQKQQSLQQQHLQQGQLLPLQQTHQQCSVPLQQQHEQQQSPPPQHYPHYEQRTSPQQTNLQQQQNVNENQELPPAKEQQLPQLQQQQLNQSRQLIPPEEQQQEQQQQYHQQQQQLSTSLQIQIIPPKHHHQQCDEEATNQYSGSDSSNGKFQVLPSSVVSKRRDDANWVEEREKSQFPSPQQRQTLSQQRHHHDQEGIRQVAQIQLGVRPQQLIEPSLSQQNRQEQELQEVPPSQQKQQLSQEQYLQQRQLLPLQQMHQQWPLPLQQHEQQQPPLLPQHHPYYEQRPLPQQAQQEQQNVNENQELPPAKEQQLPQLQQQQLNQSHQLIPPEEQQQEQQQQYHQVHQQQQLSTSHQIQIIPPKHHHQQYDEEATNQYSGSNSSNGKFQVSFSSVVSQRQDDASCVEFNKASPGHSYQKKDERPADTTEGQKNSKAKIKQEKIKASPSPLLASSQLPSNLKQVEPEKGVTVVFHVLLMSNFKMEEERLHIRAGGEDLGDFYVNCVDLTFVGFGIGKEQTKLMRFTGQCTLSMDRARRGTIYKYVVLKKRSVHWEELVEFPPRYFGIMDRFLKIPDKHLTPGEKWHQFDGVSYIYGERSWWETIRGHFQNEETVKNRTVAFLTFMPKWKGFLANEAEEEMTATEAIVELNQVVSCVANVWVKESGVSTQKRKPPDFNIEKVLAEIVTPTVIKNAFVLADGKTDLTGRTSVLVSSLAVVVLLKTYDMFLQRDIELLLLKCLALEGDSTAKTCTAYEAVLEEFNEGLRTIAAEGIEKLCNRNMGDAGEAGGVWVFAVPLLHFLRGDSKPFQEPDIAGSYNKLDWIGAQKLRIRELQRSEKQNLPDALPQLASAFEVDRLLKRTFLHAIPIWELHEIVPSKMFQIFDICVALVIFCSRESVPNSKWKKVECCLKMMITQLEERNDSTDTRVDELEFTTSVCLKLFEVCLKQLKFGDHMEVICNLVKLLLTSIQRQRKEKMKRADDMGRQGKEEELMNDMLKILRKKLMSELPPTMCSYYKRDSFTRELMTWSDLLWVAEENQGFDAYREFWADELTKRARRLDGKYLVEIFCEVQMDVYDKAVGESFSKLAFEAVEKMINSPRKGDADRAFVALRSSSAREDPRNTGKYGELLSMMLTKSWPKGGGTEKFGLDPQTVEFLLTWNPMTGYLKFFGDGSGKGRILSPEGQETLYMAKSLLEALVRVVADASVTVQILLLLKKNQQRFLELVKTCSVVDGDENSKVATKTEQSLTDRIEEIEEFQATKEKLLTFTRMCDLIHPVNIVHTKKKAGQDVSMIPICDLCKRKEDKRVEVTFFELPPMIEDVLSLLQKVQESATFQELWVKCGHKAQTARKNDETHKRDLSISNVVDSVWKPAYDAWSQLVSSVMNGTLTLGGVDKFFESYKNRKEDLIQELVCIFNLGEHQAVRNTSQLKTTAAKRASQIQHYHELHQYANAADTIWEFKEAMKFSGDFSVIEDLRDQVSSKFKQKSLDSIGKEFVEAGRALDCLNVDKARCFKAVVDSKRLVEWLRTTITSTQELKVLVDLALISAGESDMETDRISSLHTSCLGFAPLIFDLKESQGHKVNFDLLMKACEPVWKAVEADQRLPQKLCDTSRHLEWLKTVKESHGSVAMTSLVQAKMINFNGVYVVGQLACEGGSPTGYEKRLSLDDVVSLTVPPKDRGEDLKCKTYTLDELKDLQSKLMLIAGKAEKGKDEVERFVKNLEGVMRLATAYISLSESGFVHRMHWRQEFRCIKDQREGESIAAELAAASTAMENCYSTWKTKVSNARKEFHELNFFTTRQLMLLRKELAEACRRSDLYVDNLQVLTLLESVRPSLETQQLKAAIQRAFEDTDLLDQTKGVGFLLSFSLSPPQPEFDTRDALYQNNNFVDKTKLTTERMSQVPDASITKPMPKRISRVRRFLNTAEDDGYSEQVALSALASLGVDAEEDDLLLWCLEESDDADLESLYEEAMSNPVIAREICPAGTLGGPETQEEENSTTLNEPDKSIDVLSKLPLSSIDQEGSRDEDDETVISEYLTLSQLGRIIRELSVNEKRTKPRLFPAFLKRGRPNLMLVPKGDVLATVLALYMHDKQQPLPSQGEVLICTPETTTEEIELLWRRATCDLAGRFYCLVNADQLDFSVSKEAVDMLRVLTQGLAGKTGEYFGLLVICSSENEDRANIVAALDQYRVAAPPCPSSDELQAYLKRQFRIPAWQYGYINNSKITWAPAGSLDPEKLCVRIVSSSRGGLGKTLFVRRVTDQLPKLVNNDMVLSRCPDTALHVTVPLHGNSTDSSMLVHSLLPHGVKADVPLSRVFHLDVSPSVRRGLDTLLFNLLVLGSLCDKMGRLWRRRNTDLYVIEITTVAPLPSGFSREEEAESQERQSGRSKTSRRPFYDLLPTILCTTPRTVSCLLASKPDPNNLNPLFDVKEFRSPQFQRVYQYLKLSKKGATLDNFAFVPGNIDDDEKTCLTLLLRYCGIPNPSWSEIRHFVSFLNSQLRDCEESIFCDMKMMRAILAGPNVLNLEGFRSFVVRFMIQMSRDFATPSLTEDNTVFFTKDNAERERREIEQFKLRRTWESSPHPYLFFNQDHNTMTFLGFFINSNGDLVDPQTRRILERGLMSRHLRGGLQAQRVDFTENADNWNKAEKINKLCSVMGAQWITANPNFDPDRAYELTTDNVKKIMAIHMRFRCNIPVIVMGETGCGKTRLIRYMCGLQAGPKTVKKKDPNEDPKDKGTRNMLLVKVHGGTTYDDLERKVLQAEEMARENKDKNIDTVLFFDEANTTEALSMIKEVMVDRRIRGRPIGQGLERLQFIAACNPYRRHTDDMIHKLESAGLGYHVKTEKSDDRLGHIPLRHLVYRVHALPGSMRPLIWDFGQLSHEVEGLYINQIVSRYILHECQLPGDLSTVQGVTAVLATSQKYMRDQSDECSFVSLRDVERTMQVMVWFYKHVDILGRLMKKVNSKTEQQRKGGGDVDDEDNDPDKEEPIHPLTRALVLAIGVCYHAKLQSRREDYRRMVAQSFKAPCSLPGGETQILHEITSCQRAVLNELELGPNIARNTALSENVFMMVVCIELRIPLFVVGKPGSSKSLAKTVVADNMQGDAAKSELFRTFKEVHMASYQCSPLSTPEGIVATFRQCRKLQEGKNPDRFVSVVVLDEVGLAEESPLMPLKTLHPLLEDGVTSADDVIETDEKPQRVAFIGISNWALDPAKMNRGIMLSRGVPDVRELVDSALGICSTNKRVQYLIQKLISPLADGYAELYIAQRNFETLKKCGKEEFFGLRDFYSLIKMVYAIAAKSGQIPRWHQLEHAIRRNFGGLTERTTVDIFKRYFQDVDEYEEADASTTIRLIQASLGREDVADRTNFSENRYLLILTENYAALRIMQQHLLKTSDDTVVIFGSSFPNDQEYTQICRNINRIKVCMETGRTVILLNLESLYESLYDALNQYYVYFGGQKYVDLGLGTHRVKCRVHDDFKLIVIAEKEVVYNSFPIPLINRLEKHFLVTLTSLTVDQMELVKDLRTWAADFAEVTGPRERSRAFSIGDAFVGFHEDTIPSIVMQVSYDLKQEGDASIDGPEDAWQHKVALRCKKMLLEMATPDAIARLPASGLKDEAHLIWHVYFHEQQHSSLAAFMTHVITLDDFHLGRKRKEGLFVQITTYSRLLTKNDLVDLCDQTGFHPSTVDFMTLQQFQTEQQFRSLVRTFFEHLGGDCPGILIVQCDSGDDNFNLIAGARHILMEERRNAPELLSLPTIEPVHIVLVVQLPRVAGGCHNFVGFQGGKWMSTHIDELRPPGKHTLSIEQLTDRPISDIFKTGSERQPDMNNSAQMLAVNLVRNCVQAAACRVDSEDETPERSTQRIEILLKLLPEDCESLEDETTFASVLTQRIYLLLMERESNALSANDWLYSEALAGIGVHEWGTFRKALWKRVYSAVVPILAEIIAMADRDSNLDLMNNDSAWVSILWLKILANPNILELSYGKMISPITNSVRERVQVLRSGAAGHAFHCMFPFSCLVKQRVERLLKDAFSVTAQSSATVAESLRNLIDNSEIGPLFGDARHQYFSMVLAYLADFVHMMYKPSSPSEHELVCEAILSSARELGVEEDEDGNELFDIALIHVAHSRIQSRLRCFAKLVQAHPNVVPRLKEVLTANETEVLLDVVALQVCLEELNPSERVFLRPDNRRTWCDRVLYVRQTVDDMMRKERFQAVTEEISNYGEEAKTLLHRCRSMWQRAGAVRLFVERVTLFNEQDDGFNTESVVHLWKALGEEVDFSLLTSLQTIEKFLINYIGEVQRRGDGKIDSELRRRCNAFFMELVSLFCFGESSKDLEQDALSLLMRYVIGRQSTQTRDFSPFPDYGIDPTPVVRSFLLQQLLRSSTKLVKEHLDVFLQEAQSLKPEPQHIKEVCFLCVQCMEDTLISRYQAKVVDSKLTVKLKHVKRICDEVFTAFKPVAVDDDRSFEMNANSLESVAKGRYVLTLVADYLNKVFIEGGSSYSGDLDAQRELISLLHSTKRLCIEGSSSTPQLFLVKQLVRRYGFVCVRTLVKDRELEWIVPPEARQQEEDAIQDRFVVHKDQYRDIREGVAKTVISGNTQDLVSSIAKSEVQGVYKNVLLLLAFYREITLVNASFQQKNVSEEVKEKLDDFIQNGGNVSSKAQPFARQLLENSQGGQFRGLQVFPGKSPQEHTLAEIIIHTSVALQCVGPGSLAEPLYVLMADPSKMTNSYLPTMPEDNYLECINVIAQTMQGTGYDGQWYECGNCKHPYFIGECSKPTEKSQCPDCGRVLGGEQHRFLGEHKISDRKDRTKTGHALGEPGSRPTIAEPQRNLSPILCSLLRIVMHSAMVMGACRNAQATAQVITPTCQPGHVAEFLWQHMQRDLDVLGRALGRSVDDAALVVHLVLHQMVILNGGQTAKTYNMRLQTRDSRRDWETDFSAVVIAPVIRKLDQNLQKASKLLMEDERFGSDPLVRQLYEFEEQIEDPTSMLTPMSRSLWKYRRQVTVEHLGNSFQQEAQSTAVNQYKVLGAFLKQEHKLRSVQFLPDIVRLQRLLMDRFHKRIETTDAEKFQIREFLQSLPRGHVKDEYSSLIQRFKLAWNSCRSFLGEQGRLRVPQDLCNIAMDNNCPIAMLLPSTTGMGVCSMSLLFFLVNTHDEFLGTYRSVTNQESPLERVSVTEVTMSQLIAYDPERDLLPLILAHCNYSLEVGQETFVQYDWAALERQLIDKFLRGRPFVEFKEERFAFSRDTRDDTVFASLADKISQELISRVIEGQIISDLRSSLSDVCDVLSSLDIAIGFLASSGGQTETSLRWYLHEVLKLPRDRGLKSPTAEQHCNLSHTLALWRLIALEKAKIKSRNKQEPFEQVPDVFKEKLRSSEVAHLNRALRKIDMDLFLPRLLEMILLKVKYAEENVATMSFQEYFELYLAEKDFEQIPGTENIPDSVTMAHLQAVWNSAVQLCDDVHRGTQSATA